MKYAHIIAEFYSRAWAIREEVLIAMRELIRQQALGAKWSAEEIRERIDSANEKNGTKAHSGPQFCFLPISAADGAHARRGGSANSSGSVALIPIVGIISHRMNMMADVSGPGGTSIQKLTAQFRQALQDTNCKAIVFDVDSPGGSVEGVMELASEIYEGRKQKPITAVFNAMGCSAAYWLASAASEVVCCPSGQCGSIGVYMVHQDESKALEQEGVKITLIKAGKFKTEGDPSQPLSDEAKAAFQSKVDDYYGMFVKSVAQNRGTSQAKVRDGYGEGRSLLAQDAVKQNLADKIGTLDDVLSSYGVKPGAASQLAENSTMSTHSYDHNHEVRAGMPPCGCACNACNACTGRGSASSDDGMKCGCACDACKACTGKGASSLGARGGSKPADPDNDQDQDDPDNPCGCACNACSACTGSGKAGADDDGMCACGCKACKACTGRTGAKAMIHAQKAATPPEQKYAAGAAGDYLAALQRRKRELALL